MQWTTKVIGVVCATAAFACGGGSSSETTDATESTASTTASVETESGPSSASTGAASDSAATSDPSADESTGEPPGPTWSTSLDVDVDVGTFLSVWGDGVAPVYVVGGQTQPDMLTVGAMFRYDGARWTQETLPPDTFTLNWVFGVDGFRVVVGDFGEILTRDGDEGAWTQQSCATTLPLWGVWGAAADDLWIVGGDGFNRDPILCHYDGADFAQVTLPEPSLETFALFKVWGTAADHVFAVGDNGYVVHYDGVEWTEQFSGTTSDLISLWGRGPDEILAVGGRSTGTVARWDGAGWMATPQGELPGLNGIFMDDDGVATVVGSLGTAARVAAGGSTLEVEPTGTQLSLHAVFGPPGDEYLYAVGGSLDMAPPYVGVVLTRPR
jgi:hypothetical protein